MPSEASLANLRPWKPGKSAYTGQQPRGLREVLRLCRAKSPAAAKALIACVEDETAPWPSRIAAATAVLDRAWGKPKEHVQLDGAERVTSITLNIVAAQDDPSRVIDGEASELSGAPRIITITATRPGDE